MRTQVMRTRVWCAMTVALAAAVGSASADGQAPTASSSAAAATPALKTPWGHPDLQGTWDYRTITPLERPREFGTREFYTDDEVKTLESRAARRMDEPPPDGAPSAGLVHPSYWTDPGRRLSDSRRTSLIVDPPDGRIPPLTPEGQQRQASGRRGGNAGPGGRADSWLDRSNLERCITWGLPTASLPGLYNNNIQIVQSPHAVVIVHEMVHDARVIPLDDRPPLSSEIRQWIGSSRGYFEGDTLVVVTRNFSNKTNYRGSTSGLTLTERYRRVDANRVEMRLTVEDPTTWTKPWTVLLSMQPSEGELVEYACHEGNYGLRNMLEVARDAEKAEAAKATARPASKP